MTKRTILLTLLLGVASCKTTDVSVAALRQLAPPRTTSSPNDEPPIQKTDAGYVRFQSAVPLSDREALTYTVYSGISN